MAARGQRYVRACTALRERSNVEVRSTHLLGDRRCARARARRVGRPGLSDQLRQCGRREAEQAVPVLPDRLRLDVPGVQRRPPRPDLAARPLRRRRSRRTPARAARLRNAVTDVVADDYCEFNVQVRPDHDCAAEHVRSPQHRRDRHRLLFGAGLTTGRQGRASAVDTGDPTAVDFARVSGGTYQFDEGGPGRRAHRRRSPPSHRWAPSIGGTAAHEAGHNLRPLAQRRLDDRPGEDPLTPHHAGGRTHGDEHRPATAATSTTASSPSSPRNVGLSIQTMHNWDLVTSNAPAARAFRLAFLAPSGGSDQVVGVQGQPQPVERTRGRGLAAARRRQGRNLHRYRSPGTGQAWSAGRSAGARRRRFHVGATLSGIDFNQPDPMIINKRELLDWAARRSRCRPGSRATTPARWTPPTARSTSRLRTSQAGRFESATSSSRSSRGSCRSTRSCRAEGSSTCSETASGHGRSRPGCCSTSVRRRSSAGERRG